MYVDVLQTAVIIVRRGVNRARRGQMIPTSSHRRRRTVNRTGHQCTSTLGSTRRRTATTLRTATAWQRCWRICNGRSKLLKLDLPRGKRREMPQSETPSTHVRYVHRRRRRSKNYLGVAKSCNFLTAFRQTISNSRQRRL